MLVATVLRHAGVWSFLVVLIACAPGRWGAQAQPGIEVGGLAYLEYAYILQSPDGAEEGYNSFDYRRLYLTTDFFLSDELEGRFRLEAQGRATTEATRPAPFVKDAYLAWLDAIGRGSMLRFGIQPPPLFEPAESVWGYRSLEKTLGDRAGVSSSRDFGFRVDVTVLEGVKVAGMFANGNGVNPEPDEASDGKQLYGQIVVAPDGPLLASAGVDYRSVEEEDDPRTSALKASGFVGGVTERVHGGVEAFYLRNRFRSSDLGGFGRTNVGVSVFAAVNTSERTSVVARYDFVDDDAGQGSPNEHFALGAFVYRLHELVEVMPNVLLTKVDGREADLIARFTVHARF